MQLRFPITGRPPTKNWCFSEYIFIHFKFKNFFFVCETCVIRFCSDTEDDFSHWSIYTCTYAFTQNRCHFYVVVVVSIPKHVDAWLDYNEQKLEAHCFFLGCHDVACESWFLLKLTASRSAADVAWFVNVCMCAVDKPFCCSCCCKMLIWIIHEKSIHNFFLCVCGWCARRARTKMRCVRLTCVFRIFIII